MTWQGLNRTRAPEDGFQPKSIKIKDKKDVDERAKGRVVFDAEHRWHRIVMNDLENVLMGLSMHWFAFLAGGNYSVTAISVIVFAVARCAHTFCYVNELMPWRAIAWFSALLAALTASINMLTTVF